MGFFDFFRRSKRPEIVHPTFGKIVYQGDHTWELGKVLFPPVGHDVELIIDAGPDGPGNEHLLYWTELIRRWPELKAACEPLLRRRLGDWVESQKSGDIWPLVDLESLNVYAGGPPAEWELTFWCEEVGHWPTVVMRHWTPTDCFMDG